jgi:hypothetical protein
MKNISISIKVFWALTMIWLIHAAVFTTWRTFFFIHVEHTPSRAGSFLAKTLCYTGMIFVGYGLYNLWKNYQGKGFFDVKSVKTVRIMGIVTMLISIPNSVYNVIRDEILHTSKPNDSIHSLLHHFLLNFSFEAPIFLFLGMLIFLFADFMKKAINIKNDNETII